MNRFFSMGSGLILSSILTASFAFSEAPTIKGCTPVYKEFTTNISPESPRVIPERTTGVPAETQIRILASGLPDYLLDMDLEVGILSEQTYELSIDLSTSNLNTPTPLTRFPIGLGKPNLFSDAEFDDQSDKPLFVTQQQLSAGTPIGRVAPLGAMEVFKGLNPNQDWAIQIKNNSPHYPVTVNKLKLKITACEKAPLKTVVNIFSVFDLPVPDAIDNGGPVPDRTEAQFSANVSGKGKSLCDLAILTNILKKTVGDLNINLISPSGTISPVSIGQANPYENSFNGKQFRGQAGAYTFSEFYNLGFNSSAVRLYPEKSFAKFYGEDPNGTWKLSIEDQWPNGPDDQGTVASYALFMQTCDSDADSDGMGDDVDNCLTIPNSDQADTDKDKTGDACEACPEDKSKLSAGICGCGLADTDSDADGVADCIDTCSADPLKTSAGHCGCGISDTDSDADGTADCSDSCSSDPAKSAAGICGCGVQDKDTDADGSLDCSDQCLNDSNKTSPGVCGCGVTDSDANNNGVVDCKAKEDILSEINKLKTAVSALKVANNKAAKKALKAKKESVKNLLKSISTITTASGLITFSSADFKKLLSSLNSSVTKANKVKAETFGKDKKAAVKAISALVAGLSTAP